MLPAAPPVERERLADPVAGLRTVTLFAGPQCSARMGTMRYSGAIRKFIVNER